LPFYDICNIGEPVILSIYLNPGDIWFLIGDICKIQPKS
jgi:hypothetical protein